MFTVKHYGFVKSVEKIFWLHLFYGRKSPQSFERFHPSVSGWFGSLSKRVIALFPVSPGCAAVSLQPGSVGRLQANVIQIRQCYCFIAVAAVRPRPPPQTLGMMPSRRESRGLVPLGNAACIWKCAHFIIGSLRPSLVQTHCSAAGSKVDGVTAPPSMKPSGWLHQRASSCTLSIQWIIWHFSGLGIHTQMYGIVLLTKENSNATDLFSIGGHRCCI